MWIHHKTVILSLCIMRLMTSGSCLYGAHIYPSSCDRFPDQCKLIRFVTHDSWHDMWNMTHDTWHITCDRVGEVNLLSKFQLPSSYGLGVKVNLTPDTWHLTPDTWHLTPDNWHLKPETWHLTPDTWHLTPDVWHLTCDMWHVTHRRCWTLSQSSYP